MGKPKPPSSPDYANAAAAQGNANNLAAYQGSVLSNPNINTPYGSQTVSWDEGQHPTINQTLTPIGQETLNYSQLAADKLAGTASQQADRINSLLNTQFDAGADGLRVGLPNAGPIAGTSPMGTFGTASGYQGNPNTAQTNLDTSGVPNMPITPGMTAQQALMARLQPALAQNRKSAENQLAQQGLVPGGEAYDNAARLLGQQENDQLTQAALQGVNLDLAANQQGFGQALQRGQFGNQAAGQNFGQGLAQQQLGNQAIGQNYGTAIDLQNAANSAQQQGFNQNLQGGQFNNQALQQQMAMLLAQRQLPINEISALMSGSQVQNPAFQQYQGQTAAPAPLFAGTQAQGAWDQNLYNQQVAQRNAMMGGLFGLGGAATSGLFGLF